MIKAHKIRLHPTPEQATYFAKAAGTARYTFNWALAEWKRQYQAGEKPSALTLRTQFHALRKQELPWTYDVTKCVIPAGAIADDAEISVPAGAVADPPSPHAQTFQLSRVQRFDVHRFDTLNVALSLPNGPLIFEAGGKMVARFSTLECRENGLLVCSSDLDRSILVLSFQAAVRSLEP